MPAKLDLTQIPKFNAGHAAELNFVGEELRKLPANECQSIYDGLHAPHDSDSFGKAVIALLHLIVNAPDERLTGYINRVLGSSFDAYMFTDVRTKAHLFTAFFFNHLRKKGGKFFVGHIDLKTLAVT